MESPRNSGRSTERGCPPPSDRAVGRIRRPRAGADGLSRARRTPAARTLGRSLPRHSCAGATTSYRHRRRAAGRPQQRVDVDAPRARRDRGSGAASNCACTQQIDPVAAADRPRARARPSARSVEGSAAWGGSGGEHLRRGGHRQDAARQRAADTRWRTGRRNGGLRRPGPGRRGSVRAVGRTSAQAACERADPSGRGCLAGGSCALGTGDPLAVGARGQRALVRLARSRARPAARGGGRGDRMGGARASAGAGAGGHPHRRPLESRAHRLCSASHRLPAGAVRAHPASTPAPHRGGSSRARAALAWTIARGARARPPGARGRRRDSPRRGDAGTGGRGPRGGSIGGQRSAGGRDGPRDLPR